MHSHEIEKSLLELANQQKELVAAVKGKSEKPKDFWDKFSSVSTFLSGVIVAAVGLYFTNAYNREQAVRDERSKADQLRVAQVDLVHKLFPELKGSEKDKKLALIAISALGNSELATKFAALDQSEGSRAALESLALSGDSNERALAQRALKNYLSYESSFADIQGGSKIGRAALKVAIEELKSGEWQEGGPGQGTRIKKYSAFVGRPEGIPWSGAFVSWCFAQGQNPPPFPPSPSWSQLLHEFDSKGWRHKDASYIPEPGDVVFILWRSGGSHGGIVFDYKDGIIGAIEGNAPDDPRKPGSFVVARRHQRDDQVIGFGHVP